MNNYLKLLALSVGILGCSTQASNNANETSTANNSLPVDVMVAQSTPLIQEETVAGSILSNKEITIVSELTEKVESIHFKEGSQVYKDQLLYTLDDTKIRSQLKQIQAEVHLATLNEARLSQLVNTESVRQEEYDVVLTKLRSLQASEELVQAELNKTLIRAPFSGIIGITQVEAGSLVVSGQALTLLQQQETVKVAFAVAEQYLPHVKIGKEIEFSVAGQTTRLKARISATASGVDTQTRTITVHATASNKNRAIRPGMSARVYFSTVEAGTTGITVPTESLIPSAQGYSVYTIRNATAKITPVIIGNRTESEALITSGLVDGDTVMTSNMLRAVDGMPVQVVTIK